MKKTLIVFASILLFGFIFSSCNKETELNSTDSAEDMTLIEDVFNSVAETADDNTFALVDEESIETRTSPCVEITSTLPLGQYPNTITLDYGSGCEGPHGRMRKGKIIIDISDKMINEGAVRMVSLEDFFVDNVQVLGTHSMTNNGENVDGMMRFTREVAGAQLVFPNGDIASLDALHEITFLEGFDTPARFDNKLAINGSSEGVNRKGVEFTVSIIQDLIKRGNCRWVVRGVKEITVNGHILSLDYGDGACNGVAMVTFENGNTKEINLYRKWWQ